MVLVKELHACLAPTSGQKHSECPLPLLFLYPPPPSSSKIQTPPVSSSLFQPPFSNLSHPPTSSLVQPPSSSSRFQPPASNVFQLPPSLSNFLQQLPPPPNLLPPYFSSLFHPPTSSNFLHLTFSNFILPTLLQPPPASNFYSPTSSHHPPISSNLQPASSYLFRLPTTSSNFCRPPASKTHVMLEPDLPPYPLSGVLSFLLPRLLGHVWFAKSTSCCEDQRAARMAQVI